ncbi:MAG: hypothetical protein WCC32_03975 [Terriglobales bacterium]
MIKAKPKKQAKKKQAKTVIRIRIVPIKEVLSKIPEKVGVGVPVLRVQGAPLSSHKGIEPAKPTKRIM